MSDQAAFDAINMTNKNVSQLETQLALLEMVVSTILGQMENKSKILAEIRQSLLFAAEQQERSLAAGQESPARLLGRRLGLSDL
jgi:predicted DNA-binding protein YlxM (UPF0122 family)